MKKVVFILIINILLLSLIELFCYIYACNRNKNSIIGHYKVIGKNPPQLPFISKPSNKFIHYIKYPSLRIIPKEELAMTVRKAIEKKGTTPIVLFGCSFVEGVGLNEEQTVSYKLAKYTNHSVINRGRSASGITHLYWQLNQNEVLNNIPNDTERIAFFFIEDHIYRLYSLRSWIMDNNVYPKYKLVDDELIEVQRFLPIHNFFSSFIVDEFLCNKNLKNKDKTKKLVTKLFNESNKKIKYKFPNAKFFIFVIDNEFDLNFFSDLDENIEVVRLPVYNETDHFIADGYHPSEKYWDTVVPYIAEKLNLNK